MFKTMPFSRWHLVGFIATVLFPVLVSGSGALHAGTIRLKSRAVTASSLVRMGDVAEITAADPQWAQSCRNVVLAPAPPSGGRLQISFDEIRSRLHARGFNLADMEFSGRSVVTVVARQKPRETETSVTTVSGEERPVSQWQRKQAEKRVREAVRRHLRQKDAGLEDVALSLRVPPDDVKRLLEDPQNGYQVRGGRPPWNAPQTFTLQFLDSDGQQQEVTVRGRIQQRPKIVALQHAVPRGHVLRASDLAWKTGESPGGGYTQMQEVIGRETVRALRKGDALDGQDIRNVPLVRTNDIVTVSSRQPGIVVQRQLKAREDGARGDTVTLVTLDGRNKVLARVTGFHEAEVVGAEQSSQENRPRTAERIQFVKKRNQ